ncbi:hypothetical protein DYB35_000743 [Aphanomyces astaci]|uniref:Uncharacterized protein n=1 Tax=Aphanomyces astaci TaxID=112090 RepID=A0A3R6WTM4_APHAT|nr:hypothetical protein DYB35_000743 [Aphanomyces astaci]
MEALELHPGASFLNVGSGSGYLSCLVGAITGKVRKSLLLVETLNEMLIRLQDSINHGLEIDPGVVDSCRASLTQYANHQRRGSARDAPPNNQVDDSDDEDGGTSELSDEDMHEDEVPQQGIEGAKKQVDASFSVCHVVCGDVFRMNVAKNMKYDRYGPFEDKLKKIRRRDGDQFSEVVLGNVTFAPMREVSNNGGPIEDAICYFPPLVESNSREDAEKRALKAEGERDKFRLLLWRQQNQIQHLMARLARGELQEDANNPIRAGHEGDAGDDDELVSSDDDMSDDDDL